MKCLARDVLARSTLSSWFGLHRRSFVPLAQPREDQGKLAENLEKWGWAICIGIHRISAMDQEFSTPKKLIIPLKIRFFRLKTPGNFRDFLGDHFARVESSGDQNLTMFTLDFHVFFPKLSQNDPKMILKWSQNDPKMIPKWSQNDLKMIPKWFQNDPKMMPKWSQNDPKMIPTWSQNNPKMILKWF